MSWNSTIRSIGAASRRIQRENDRIRRRESKIQEAQRKEGIKELQSELARLQVEIFDSQIESLSGVGRKCGEAIDWERESQMPDPQEPLRADQHEVAATCQHAKYRPGLIDRMTGKGKKMKEVLFRGIDQARKRDDREHEQVKVRHQDRLKGLKEQRQLASEMLAGNVDVYGEVMREVGGFGELSEVGSHFSFNFGGSKKCYVEIEVMGIDIVPNEQLSLTSTGKLSKRKMAAGKVIEIYQDYVCGSLFRMARELKAILPVEFVLCSAYHEVLNSSTGRKERVCICSAGFSVGELEHINFSRVDFSDAMSLFRHTMKHSKRAGFSPVEPLKLEDFDLSWIESA